MDEDNSPQSCSGKPKAAQQAQLLDTGTNVKLQLRWVWIPRPELPPAAATTLVRCMILQRSIRPRCPRRSTEEERSVLLVCHLGAVSFTSAGSAVQTCLCSQHADRPCDCVGCRRAIVASHRSGCRLQVASQPPSAAPHDTLSASWALPTHSYVPRTHSSLVELQQWRLEHPIAHQPNVGRRGVAWAHR